MSIIICIIKIDKSYHCYSVNVTMEYTVWLSARTIVETTLATYGLITYAIVLIPLTKFRKALFFTPFYTICFAMAFFDIAQLISSIILCLRIPILPYSNLFYLKFDGFLSRSFWYCSTCIEFMIALERTVIVFCKPGSKLVSNKFHKNIRHTVQYRLTYYRF